ncbi:hypothetical protein [Methylomonas koyamae]|nr:hypothetical protein [Methylomonas koyamae]
MAYLAEQGAVAIGQTSWGPTGFCAVASPEVAAGLLTALQRKFAGSPLSFMVASARNQPAELIGG